MFHSSNGIFTAVFSDDGTILDMSNRLFEGCAVTHCQFVRNDVVIVAIVYGQSISKLMTLNVETKETMVLLEMDSTRKTLGIVRVPQAGDPFFIV